MRVPGVHFSRLPQVFIFFLPQSDCPPTFISTNAACFHLLRYNIVCYILDYLVLHLPMCLPDTNKWAVWKHKSVKPLAQWTHENVSKFNLVTFWSLVAVLLTIIVCQMLGRVGRSCSTLQSHSNTSLACHISRYIIHSHPICLGQKCQRREGWELWCQLEGHQTVSQPDSIW